MIKNLLQNYIKDYKITLTENQYEQFQKYFELLAEWNEKMNLTAITDESGVALKHFADSLSLLNFVDIPQNSSLADVGTGAGFPGVVLKIARPDIKLTLIDSLNKRLVSWARYALNSVLKPNLSTAERRMAQEMKNLGKVLILQCQEQLRE